MTNDRNRRAPRKPPRPRHPGHQWYRADEPGDFREPDDDETVRERNGQRPHRDKNEHRGEPTSRR